uniref:Uncharacterized protein n=1 Tax=Anguilla anguilla TaxID=7936 RepID=A0A0E9PI44_ANGAN
MPSIPFDVLDLLTFNNTSHNYS